MTSRRLPRGNRVKGRDGFILNEYEPDIARDSDTLIGSVGDPIRILKNYTTPHHEIDFKGDKNPRGRHGGRRQLQPENIPNYDKISGVYEEPVRPADPYELDVPGIVDLSPTEEIRLMHGFSGEDTGTVYIATKFLADRGLEIDPSKDYFNIRGTVYKIRSSDDFVNMLGKIQVAIYIIRKSF